ncbi:UNVERIFIED_CONTAM: Retrovirus-related Pol polyprotein from transposon RE1 [Sesamum latifolium]|uniref:Retrovirus-related Pol polyprotein from transposon RE1 n=1 Tax=Sesamum latifolium TaxID=2727402 RepID=A0AAW2XR37_9LAMI
MVTSWIWNSMSKDIVEAFMYCASSRELWLAIQTRYGRSNGPMVYQLQRDLSAVLQDDLTLTAYLTKVTKLWNELSYLAPTPQCTCGGCICGVNKAITDLTASTQLMQFLMGLHESYSSERSQILMQDPLPDIEKAFYMVYAVEKQREVHSDLASNSNHMVCQLAFKSNRREDEKLPQKKKTFMDKKGTFCTHCRKTGHSQETCFQLHGVLEWYKTLNDKKKKGRNFAANIDGNGEMLETGSTQNVTHMMSKLLKVLQSNTRPTDPISNFANFVHFDEEFAENTPNAPRLPVVPFHLDSPSNLPAENDIIPTMPVPPVESARSHIAPSKTTNLSSLPLRRSSRQKHRPSWFNDFVSSSTDSSLLHCCNSEIEALEHNHTWRLTPLPEGKRPIGLAKPVTMGLFFTLAAANDWSLHQLDVNNAFLHGYLEEDLYMLPPEDILCLLDIGEARYLLGLEIARNSSGIYVAQTIYIMDIIKDTSLTTGKAVGTPFPCGLKLSTDCGALLTNPYSYRRLIGRLLYLGFTRSDISYSVQQLSQFLNKPCDAHWKAALHIVHYLKSCPTKGLFFPSQSNFELKAFCDADCASCKDSRRSLTGFCIFLGDADIS